MSILFDHILDRLRYNKEPEPVLLEWITASSTDELTNKTMDNASNFIHADWIHARVKAVEPLLHWDPVCFHGFNFWEEAIEVRKRTDWTTPVIWVMHSNLTTWQFGMMVSIGFMKNIDTSDYSVGQILYPDNAGWFTTVPNLTNGNYNQPIAYVLKAANNWVIEINVGPGHDTANMVAFDNSESTLLSTNVWWAIVELDWRTVQSAQDISTIDWRVWSVETLSANLDDLVRPNSWQYGWRDLMAPIDPRWWSTWPDWTPFRNWIYMYAFQANQVDETYSSFHIDHDYMLGTALYPHIHFSVNTTQSWTIRWWIEWTYAKWHWLWSFWATNTIYLEQAINWATDQYKHFVLETPDLLAIPWTDIDTDWIILVRLFRDAPHVNDTYPWAAFWIQMDMHYRCDKYSTKNKAPDFNA